MTGNSGLRTVLYMMGAVAAIATILWAESTIWLSVKEIRERAETLSSDRFHHSDHLEAKIREINAKILDESSEPNTQRRQAIELDIQKLRDWLSDPRSQPIAPAQIQLLAKIGRAFEQFAAHWNVQIPGKPSQEWRLINGQLMAELLQSASELNRLEKTALSEFMAGTQNNLESLYRQLIFSSLVLLVMGATLGLLAYHGILVPLQSRLAHSQHVIERQEKLSSLGVLAAGVAHEIRNPLTSIKARLFTQQALLEPDSEASEDNHFITEEISRLEKIVSDFLAFARPSEPRLVRIHPSQPLRELDGLFRPALTKANIKLTTEFLEDPEIEVDPSQLKQVLINLVQNAAESIGRDGSITIRTRTLSRRPRSHGPAVALIEVQDTGKGIPPEAQKRLFDPFFTTKPSGTGLGLSIAARILEKHGGSLEYETELQRGTVFRLVLPLAS